MSLSSCIFLIACGLISKGSGLKCHQCYNNPDSKFSTSTIYKWLQQAVNATKNAQGMQTFFKEIFGEKEHRGKCLLPDDTETPPMECDDKQTCFNATYNRLLLAKGCWTPLGNTALTCGITPPENQALNVSVCSCQSDFCNGDSRGNSENLSRSPFSAVLMATLAVFGFRILPFSACYQQRLVSATSLITFFVACSVTILLHTPFLF
ncbi:uncharacterized protein LOC129590257 [Paramacrobiotus metropolitanus]|uniref:uncharacterized protein LOC129590257 n=1 Tax=Paramacrobiotus metropolitanus TaxID=2943436 RepID=UPI0024465539|nr:uncharacterized protein LOC129590257 [Paramacrobiotus metropolitanus]